MGVFKQECRRTKEIKRDVAIITKMRRIVLILQNRNYTKEKHINSMGLEVYRHIILKETKSE